VCQQQAVLIASKAVVKSGTLNHLAIWEEHPSFTLSGNKNGRRKFKIEQALSNNTYPKYNVFVVKPIALGTCNEKLQNTNSRSCQQC
jgi:hypothetical protein